MTEEKFAITIRWDKVFIKKLSIGIISMLLFFNAFQMTAVAEEDIIDVETDAPIEENAIMEVKTSEPILVHGDITHKMESIMHCCPVNAIDYIKDAYKNINRIGDYGRLFVPRVGIDVAAFRKDLKTNQAQLVTDREDSACVFKYGVQFVIADHKHQGFDALYGVKMGDLAVIKRPNGDAEVLVCVGKDNGVNAPGLYLNGVKINRLNPGGYTTYTCNENRYNVTMVFWQPVLVGPFESLIPMTVGFYKMEEIIKAKAEDSFQAFNSITNRFFNEKDIVKILQP